jgi:hypothetical protein
MTALDVAGRELKVGQQVAYCMAGKAQNMRLAHITKLSPKTAELDAKAYESPYANFVRRGHSALCIVGAE